MTPVQVDEGDAAPAPRGRSSAARPRGARLWTYRIATLLLAPCLLVVVLEGVLRFVGAGHSPGFTRPCEVTGEAARCDNPPFAWQFFPRAIARSPVAFAFPERKPRNTVRIFVVGGSAAQGDPEPSFGFSRILEVMLEDRHPGLHFEVVNAAMTAVNSHVMLPVTRDLARFEPDLFLVYLGNNEVVGPFGAGTIFSPPVRSRALIEAGLAVRRSRIGQLISRLVEPFRTGSAPDEWRGMEMFVEHRVEAGDPRLELVYAHFRDNLQDIVAVARRSGARVAVSTVGCDLRDTAPFADPAGGGAGRAFAKGTTQWMEGNHRGACASFETARDLDALRFRADTRINNIIREVAGENPIPGVEMVEGEAALLAAAEGKCPGSDLFLDHVHLDFRGNVVLASAFLPAVERLLGLDAAADPGVAESRAPEWYEARLAHSGYDVRRTVEEMRRRMSRPPFLGQSNHEWRMDLLERRSEELAIFDTRAGQAAADTVYRRATDLRPADPWIRYNHGVLLTDLGDPKRAAEAFRAFLRRIPHDVPAREKLSVSLAASERFAEALEICETLNREQPDFDPPYYTRAYALARLGRLDESLAVYREMLVRDPGMSPRIWREIGTLLSHLGRETEAREAFRKSAEAAAGQEPAAR